MSPAFAPASIWGCATSAYPIEGSPLADGAGPSIGQRFARTPGRIAGGDTGNVACDHCRRMPVDVALMKALGLTACRFGIKWGPVLPEGRCAVNAAGLGFYERPVDELLAAGITPLATLHHRELPQALEDREPPWATIDEPRVVAEGGCMHGVPPPATAACTKQPRTASCRRTPRLSVRHRRAAGPLPSPPARPASAQSCSRGRRAHAAA